jgi:hypothetical protein
MTITISRRSVLLGLAAPAVVSITSLMPARTPRALELIKVMSGIIFPTRDEVMGQLMSAFENDFGTRPQLYSQEYSLIESVVDHQMGFYANALRIISVNDGVASL